MGAACAAMPSGRAADVCGVAACAFPATTMAEAMARPATRPTSARGLGTRMLIPLMEAPAIREGGWRQVAFTTGNGEVLRQRVAARDRPTAGGWRLEKRSSSGAWWRAADLLWVL